MDKQEIKNELQKATVQLNELLKLADKEGITSTFKVERPSSSTDMIIENIQLSKLSMTIEEEFEVKTKGEW